MKKAATFTFLLLILTATGTSAQQECPRKLKDCPGLCGWFIDMDGDGFCDIGGLSDNMKALLKKRSDSLQNAGKENKVKNSDSLQKNTVVTDKNKSSDYEHPCDPCPHKKICDSTAAAGTSTDTLISDTTSAEQLCTSVSGYQKYHLILIFGALLGLYLISSLLHRYGEIRKSTHRKIWNSLLLITFLVTGLIGIFMVLQLNYEFSIPWFRSLLYWHVEFGIAMASISFFHVWWHWKYFIHLFRQRREEKDCN